jgi:hypothetical protein
MKLSLSQWPDAGSATGVVEPIQLFYVRTRFEELATTRPPKLLIYIHFQIGFDD